MTLDQWNAIIDVNIRGMVHGISAAHPQMVHQGHGHIVSTAADQVSSWVTTKHVVVGLSMALRSEPAARGVGVLVGCPSDANTFLVKPRIAHAHWVFAGSRRDS